MSKGYQYLRNSIFGYLWMLIIVAAIIGCGVPSRQEITINCSTFGLSPVGDASQTFDFRAGLSVSPPKGQHWCIQEQTGNRIVFSKSPLSGQTFRSPPPFSDRAHTFVALAGVVSIDETTIDTAQDLRSFVERWLQAGGTLKFLGTTIVLHVAPNERATLIDSKVEPVHAFEADCVRYDATMEETNHPASPNVVLINNTRNSFICRHPFSSDRIFVWISYSERYLKEAQPRSLLVNAWKSEVDPFVQSLQFSPPR